MRAFGLRRLGPAFALRRGRRDGLSGLRQRGNRPKWAESLDFVERIHRLNLPLVITARHKDAADLDWFAISNLAKGELVALSFKSVLTRRTNHWALAVGSEGVQCGREAQTDTLLLLDSSATEPVFRAFNARLRMSETSQHEALKAKTSKPKPVIWLYDSTEWAPEQVRLTSAIRFRLSG